MLRVATYNLLHGLHLGARGELDLDAAAEVIACFAADLVAVQEVDRGLDRSGGVDQVAELAARLGWHGVFAPALLGDPEDTWSAVAGDDPGGPAYGVGLLSRWPLAHAERLPLPGGGDGRRRRPATLGNPGWDREPRVALRASLRLPGNEVRVTTTHLSYLPVRGIAQLHRVGQWARGAQGAAGEELPAVLLGDLNLPARVTRLVLADWCHAVGPATYPSAKPRMRADQILARALRPGAVRAEARTTSDHLALIAELSGV